MCRSTLQKLCPWCRGPSKKQAEQENKDETREGVETKKTERMEENLVKDQEEIKEGGKEENESIEKKEGDENFKENQGNQDGQEQPEVTHESDQQTQEQNLILRQLQSTMDPLVAARVYNSMYTIFDRLPDELLLKILHCIGENALTLHCHRRVSTTLRRIIYSPDIAKYTYVSPARNYFTEDYMDFPHNLREQLWRRLQRDEMCDGCRLYRISTASDVLEAPADSPVIGHGYHRTCKFSPGLHLGYRPRLFCESCRHQRPLKEFAAADQRRYVRHRQCIGCQGTVKLCEHVNIKWATIKDHITSWQKQRPGDWQACYNNFKVECKHPSHDKRCHARATPTWPRARLRSACDGTDRIVLELKWEPHSGNIFGCPPDGLVPTSEMKALFRSYRLGAASEFFPSYPSNPLPEMACFEPSDCGCLRYEGDNSQRPNGKYSLQPTNFFKKGLDKCFGSHKISRLTGHGPQGDQVRMRKHWPKYNDGSVCLITTYQRRILLCQKSDFMITPTHSWIHAMDPDTYPSPDADPAFPVCRNEDCINYCRRPRATGCIWNEEYYYEN